MTLHRDQDQEPCGRGAKKALAENTAAFGTEIYNTLTHTSREQSASTGIDRGGGGGKMAAQQNSAGRGTRRERRVVGGIHRWSYFHSVSQSIFHK